jgi:citrate lyase subunit beta / citryl-CoA lyase
MTARSYLYVPGDRPELIAKAMASAADAIIIDLEDAVPPDGKPAARRHAHAWTSGAASAPLPATDRAASAGPATGPQIWVRINPGELGRADVAAVLGGRLAGLCVAKTESVAELVALDQIITQAEIAAGLPAGRIQVAPLLESGRAVLDAAAIARGPRVVRLQLGEADLCADLGVTPGPDERELLWVRSQVVVASAAAGIDPPVAPVSTNFRDPDALAESTAALRRLGFLGRACVHPAQLPVVHAAFTPTSAEVEAAQDVIGRYDDARAAGSGVCVDARGRLVDEAVVRSARRLLGLAR